MVTFVCGAECKFKIAGIGKTMKDKDKIIITEGDCKNTSYDIIEDKVTAEQLKASPKQLMGCICRMKW